MLLKDNIFTNEEKIYLKMKDLLSQCQNLYKESNGNSRTEKYNI